MEYTKEEHQKDASIYGQILIYDFSYDVNLFTR